jgi:tetratricopeptide (TPR) repeat protein
MQNHISKLNRERVETFSASFRSVTLSLLAVLMLASGVARAQAQQGGAASKKEAKGETVIPISPMNTRTRSRRAAAKAAGVDAKTTENRKNADAAPVSADVESLETESVDAAAVSKSPASGVRNVNAHAPVPDENGAEQVAALRANVEEAMTEEARGRAQKSLVDYLIEHQRNGEATAELRLMMREERLDPIGFYNIGNALANLGDAPTAVDAYRKAIEQRHGFYSRAYNNLGVVLMRLERFDEAFAALNTALQQENFLYPAASRNLERLAELRARQADVAAPPPSNKSQAKP